MQQYPVKYDKILPAHGLDASRWVIEVLFQKRAQEAWACCVTDVDDPSHWKGGRLGQSKGLESFPEHAGHYYNVTLLKPGADRRTDENADAGVAVMFDDVGDLITNPLAKMDKQWLDMFGPTPTFAVETSPNNFQYVYGFASPCAPAAFRLIVQMLKAHPPTRGGFRDASGMARYARLPSGRNPKPGRNLFPTRLTEASGMLYEPGELLSLFGLRIEQTQLDRRVDRRVDRGVDSASSVLSSTGPDQCDIKVVDALLNGPYAPLANDGPFDDYDEFMALMHRVKGATLHDEAGGLEAFERWAATWKHPQNKPVHEKWATIHAPRMGAHELWLRAGDLDKNNRVAKTIFGVIDPLPPGASRKAQERVDEVGRGEDADDDPEPSRGLLDDAGDETPAQGGPPSVIKALFKAPTVLPGFDRQGVTLIAGKTGAYKSVYALQAGAAISFNRPDIVGWTTKDLDWRSDVIVLANEDSENETLRRLRAIVARHKIDLTTPHRPLNVWEDAPLFQRRLNGKSKTVGLYGPTVRKILEYNSKRSLALIVVDTLAASVKGGCDETNAEFQDIASCARRLARLTHACVVLVHHVKKGSFSDGKNSPASLARDDLDGVRGGSALANSIRNVLMLSKPTRDEIERIGPQACKGLTCVTMTKRSHGRIMDDKWFRLTPEAIMVRDIRAPLTDIPDDSIALVEESMTALGTAQSGVAMRDAVRKIAERLDAGETVIRAARGRNRSGTAQDALGKNDKDTGELIDKLVEGGYLEIMKSAPKREGGWSYDEIHVTTLGRAIIEEGDEQQPF
jgi:hypothetical protein